MARTARQRGRRGGGCRSCALTSGTTPRRSWATSCSRRSTGCTRTRRLRTPNTTWRTRPHWLARVVHAVDDTTWGSQLAPGPPMALHVTSRCARRTRGLARPVTDTERQPQPTPLSDSRATGTAALQPASHAFRMRRSPTLDDDLQGSVAGMSSGMTKGVRPGRGVRSAPSGVLSVLVERPGNRNYILVMRRSGVRLPKAAPISAAQRRDRVTVDRFVERTWNQ